MIVTRYNERTLQQVFDACNFEKALTEIYEHDELFAKGEEYDFRQNFSGSPFKDSPMIACRMSYDKIQMAGAEPTEDELLEHLKTVGLKNTQAFDTPEYEELPEVYRAVSWLAKTVAAEQVGRVLVARLMPGGHVKPHADRGDYYDHYDRFHLCIGGDGCLFRCGRETVRMLPGEVWWFCNNHEHEVWNESDVARDHVIVDLKLKGEKNVYRTGGASPELH